MSSLRGFVGRVAVLSGATAFLLGLLFFVVRPWYLTWGTTPEERQRLLPGDGLVPFARAHGTRAITIDAPPDQVWPWLAQLGQDRGGFYSYELLEDLFGAEMNNVGRLDPALQRWTVGDKLWMYPPEKAGGAGFATLALLEPGRAMGFATRQIGTPLDAPADGSWTFVLEPSDGRATRLLIRGRAAGGTGFATAAFSAAVFEPAHFAMERKMMTTLKAHAEGRPVSAAEGNVQVLLWIEAFASMLVAALLYLSGRAAARTLLAFVAGGLLFQLLTFVQPPPLVGAPLLMVLVAVLIGPPRSRARKTARPALA